VRRASGCRNPVNGASGTPVGIVSSHGAETRDARGTTKNDNEKKSERENAADFSRICTSGTLLAAAAHWGTITKRAGDGDTHAHADGKLGTAVPCDLTWLSATHSTGRTRTSLPDSKTLCAP
jgi:hypothetical protein